MKGDEHNHEISPERGKATERPALVLGAGRSGRAAQELLLRRGVGVVVLDGDVPFPSGSFAFAVVSPGLALTHPWIMEARRRSIPLMSELQLGCTELKRQGWKLLAVTGSKGKSSVVKLVADALRAGGNVAIACGNYGRPVSDVALSAEDSASSVARWAVVEVSSFMMETTTLPSDTFEAAVVLNLQEDHLDRHGDRATYHALKRKLLSFARRGLMPCADDTTSDPRMAGSYFDNAILRSNGKMAIALMRTAGLDDGAIARAFQTFEPLPHRMQELAVLDGVRYVDDSKATSLAALAAGVTMAGSDVWLIAGGRAKGDDPGAIRAPLTERVKKVYLIGESAEKLFDAWQATVACEICGTLERATAAAMREVQSGGTVLLSPGAASFDQFRNFEERGDVFARLIKKERKKK